MQIYFKTQNVFTIDILEEFFSLEFFTESRNYFLQNQQVEPQPPEQMPQIKSFHNDGFAELEI